MSFGVLVGTSGDGRLMCRIIQLQQRSRSVIQWEGNALRVEPGVNPEIRDFAAFSVSLRKSENVNSNN